MKNYFKGVTKKCELGEWGISMLNADTAAVEGTHNQLLILLLKNRLSHTKRVQRQECRWCFDRLLAVRRYNFTRLFIADLTVE